MPAPPDPDAAAPIDAQSILRELSERWRRASTLEYRSRAVMQHEGEFRVEIAVYALLRRPRLARVVFDASRADVTRIRVCDGGVIRDHTKSVPLRPGRVFVEPFSSKVTNNIPHPLDEASYSVDQFFSGAPFYPPATWGERRAAPVLAGSRVSLPSAKAGEKGRLAFRVVFTSGTSRDTLTLDAHSFAPIEIVRVAEHAGKVQELLRETFTEVVLGQPIPRRYFAGHGATRPGQLFRRADQARQSKARKRSLPPGLWVAVISAHRHI